MNTDRPNALASAAAAGDWHVSLVRPLPDGTVWARIGTDTRYEVVMFTPCQPAGPGPTVYDLYSPRRLALHHPAGTPVTPWRPR